MKSDGSRKTFRPSATSWSFGVLAFVVATALRMFCSWPLANFTLPWCMSTAAAGESPLPASATTPRLTTAIAATTMSRRIGFVFMGPHPRAWQRVPASARRRTDPAGAPRAGCGRPCSPRGTARRPRRSRPRRCGSPTRGRPGTRSPRDAAGAQVGGAVGVGEARRVERVTELVAEVVRDGPGRVAGRDVQRNRAGSGVRPAAKAGHRACDPQAVAELRRRHGDERAGARDDRPGRRGVGGREPLRRRGRPGRGRRGVTGPDGAGDERGGEDDDEGGDGGEHDAAGVDGPALGPRARADERGQGRVPRCRARHAHPIRLSRVRPARSSAARRTRVTVTRDTLPDDPTAIRTSATFLAFTPTRPR